MRQWSHQRGGTIADDEPRTAVLVTIEAEFDEVDVIADAECRLGYLPSRQPLEAAIAGCRSYHGEPRFTVSLTPSL